MKETTKIRRQFDKEKAKFKNDFKHEAGKLAEDKDRIERDFKKKFHENIK